jgi:hypothetical protein
MRGGGKLKDDVAAHALTGHDRRSAPSQAGDNRHQIGNQSVEVVSVVRAGGHAVAPLVDGRDRMAGVAQQGSDAVPETSVRRQSVYQDDGGRRTRFVPDNHRQIHTGGDGSS